MINQEMETMENKLILSIILGMLCISLVSAGALDLTPIQDKEVPTSLTDKEVIKADGIYVNNIKTKEVKDANIWIDKLVGTTYHVDSKLKEKTNIRNVIAAEDGLKITLSELLQ